jgi:hypothetical protein
MTLTTFGRRLRARTVLLLFVVFGAVAASAPAAHAAAGDPDLQVAAPTNVQLSYFDDHSVVGDNHNGWASGAGDPKWSAGTEPFLLTFSSSVLSAGAPLTLCNFARPTNGNTANAWMQTYQALPGATCNAAGSPSAPPVGWTRYVVANHHQQDRWQFLDFVRYALVPAAGVPAKPPLPAAVTGPGDPNDPLRFSVYDPSCTDPIFTATLPGSNPPSPQLHCWQPAGIPARPSVPATGTAPVANGQQGVFWDTRWGSCLGWFSNEDPNQLSNWCGKDTQQNTPLAGASWTLAPNERRGTEIDYPSEPSTTGIAFDALRDVPGRGYGTYYLVAWVNPYGALHESTTANNIACTALSISAPTPADGSLPFHVAQLPTAQQPASCPWSATANVAAPPSTVKPTRPGEAAGKLPKLTSTRAKSYAKRALAKAFGKLPKKGVSVSCRLARKSKTTSTCSISYRKNGTRYRGTVKIQIRQVGIAGVWRYAVDVKRTRNGTTKRIHHGYKTGGTIKLTKK